MTVPPSKPLLALPLVTLEGGPLAVGQRLPVHDLANRPGDQVAVGRWRVAGDRVRGRLLLHGYGARFYLPQNENRGRKKVARCGGPDLRAGPGRNQAYGILQWHHPCAAYYQGRDWLNIDASGSGAFHRAVSIGDVQCLLLWLVNAP
jgi:hypothetical protein